MLRVGSRAYFRIRLEQSEDGGVRALEMEPHRGFGRIRIMTGERGDDRLIARRARRLIVRGQSWPGSGAGA